MSHLEQNDVSGEKFSIVSSFEFSACKIMLQYTKYLLFIDSLIDWCLTRFSFQSSVCDKIMSQLGQDDVDRKQRRVVIINQDSTQELEYLFFLSHEAQFFFPEFNIRLYNKNSESEYYFFPPLKSEYFFQQHWESEYFLR
jgi:hypothetical protein